MVVLIIVGCGNYIAAIRANNLIFAFREGAAPHLYINSLFTSSSCSFTCFFIG